MSRRDFEVFLWDVIDSGEAIQGYVSGKTFDDYLATPILRDAVERRFTTIGEALSQTRRLRSDLELRNARGAIALRNVVVHGYHDVDDQELWRIIHEELPLLLTEVRALLGPAPA
jgi:uncharacterized protein with HEPN domain